MIPVSVAADVYDMLRATVGGNPPECGAILGGSADLRRIDRIWYDAPAGCGKGVYVPSAAEITAVVREWEREGRSFLGIVHSHSPRLPMLSAIDIQSGVKILRANPMHALLLGLFCGDSFGLFRLALGEKSGQPLLIRVPYTVEK